MVQIKLHGLNSWPALMLFLAAMALAYGAFFHLTGIFVPAGSQARIMDAGGRDLPIYWCAWQIHTQNGNLYSLPETQKHRSDPIDSKDVIHNPPWSLWLFAPVVWLPYESAHIAWIIINFLLIPLNVFLSLRLFRISAPQPFLLLFMCIFAPAFLCWYYGQVSLALTAMTLLMLYWHRLRWDWLVGACLACMTIKPHIYYLLAFLIGLNALIHFRWRIFAGFTVTLGVLLLPFWMTGSAISDWLHWIQGGQATIYMTTNISTWIRIFIAADNGIPPVWPMYLIPAISLTAGSCWLLSRKKTSLIWEELSIPLMAVSLLTAPYSWAYDFCLLMGWHVVLVSSWNQGRRVLPAVTCLCTFFFMAQTTFLQRDMHFLVWFPVAVIILWACRNQTGVVTPEKDFRP
ncbi:MAG: glycosyltransferase family 87 protein [Verrucomicrobiota bacterium]